MCASAHTQTLILMHELIINYINNDIFIIWIHKILMYELVGPKDLTTPAHFISSPKSMPRRKKCSRMNKESPDCRPRQTEITEGESAMPPMAVS